MGERPDIVDGSRPPGRPSHPRWPAIFLLVGICLLLFGLAAMTTFGWL